MILVAGVVIVAVLAAGAFVLTSGPDLEPCSFALFPDHENNDTMMVGFLGAGYTAEIRKMEPANQWGIGKVSIYRRIDRTRASPDVAEAYIWPEDATGILITPAHPMGDYQATFIPVDGRRQVVMPFSVPKA
ncbi:hypothetical protein J2129_002752 [Methanofollis sp. W23]|uniref:hypothetical protein n=1 Tax=Methanofollis sp. W23 TaxID=2817849 RepID=UPI001AE15A1C|nr:hypothetical protein [Methanofollis sp. W23]MBP2147239.1 hypothetical protein [Methanofollis sp. W23]